MPRNVPRLLRRPRPLACSAPSAPRDDRRFATPLRSGWLRRGRRALDFARAGEVALVRRHPRGRCHSTAPEPCRMRRRSARSSMKGETTMWRRVLHMAVLVAGATAATASFSAHAEVHFGNNVFIGGHNVSNQTFTQKRRGEYHIHEGQPAHPGCAWRSNGDGSRTKVCDLQRRR